MLLSELHLGCRKLLVNNSFLFNDLLLSSLVLLDTQLELLNSSPGSFFFLLKFSDCFLTGHSLRGLSVLDLSLSDFSLSDNFLNFLFGRQNFALLLLNGLFHGFLDEFVLGFLFLSNLDNTSLLDDDSLPSLDLYLV